MRIPHTVAGRWPVPLSETRLAYHIRRDDPAGCRVGLLGLADDLGVRMNHGRPGARGGPTALRAALARYGVAEPYGFVWPQVFDAGDIVPAEGDDESALAETHRRVTEATGALLDLGLFPIGVGGGHDLTFPFVRAVAHKLAPQKLGGVYFDAHLDVRETAGSGMAFRKLIEECGVGPLSVFGLDAMVNSRTHWEWFLAHGGRIEEDWEKHPHPRFVSFDLDVITGACAPGVSAVNPSGLDPAIALTWVESLLVSQQTLCLDIMELNPAFDQDGRTARLSAALFLHALRGLARRTA